MPFLTAQTSVSSVDPSLTVILPSARAFPAASTPSTPLSHSNTSTPLTFTIPQQHPAVSVCTIEHGNVSQRPDPDPRSPVFFPLCRGPQVVGRHLTGVPHGKSQCRQSSDISVLPGVTVPAAYSVTASRSFDTAPSAVSESDISVPTLLPALSAISSTSCIEPSGSLLTPDGFISPSEVFTTPRIEMLSDVPPSSSSSFAFGSNNSNIIINNSDRSQPAASAAATVAPSLLSPIPQLGSLASSVTMPSLHFSPNPYTTANLDFASLPQSSIDTNITTPPNNPLDRSGMDGSQFFASLDDISLEEALFAQAPAANLCSDIGSLLAVFTDIEKDCGLSAAAASSYVSSLCATTSFSSAPTNNGSRDGSSGVNSVDLHLQPDSHLHQPRPQMPPPPLPMPSSTASLGALADVTASVGNKRHADPTESLTTDHEAKRASTLPSDDDNHGDEERQFDCRICGRKFSRKFNLTVHMRIHGKDGGRRFRCEKCNRGFTRKNDLDRHMIRHDKSLGYPCDQCDAAFARMDVLERHRRAVHGH